MGAVHVVQVGAGRGVLVCGLSHDDCIPSPTDRVAGAAAHIACAHADDGAISHRIHLSRLCLELRLLHVYLYLKRTYVPCASCHMSIMCKPLTSLSCPTHNCSWTITTFFAKLAVGLHKALPAATAGITSFIRVWVLLQHHLLRLCATVIPTCIHQPHLTISTFRALKQCLTLGT